jgi:hypothetical protein
MKFIGQFALLAATVGAMVTIPAALPAQDASETGRLMGQIVNEETGMPISGAQIVVDGSTLGTLSGIEGRYQLQGITTGEVAIRVSFLGYGTKIVTGIEILPGETARLDVTLARQAVAIEGLVVTAQQERGSTVSVLNDQRNASGVISGISAEQISRSPDGDAAAAVRRVSGVTVQDGRYVYVRGLGERYTTSSLNGARIPSPDPERKMVPLDLFPAGLLQAISTSKTFTPDQSGDFSGGSVDIRTPDFPQRRTYSLSISSGYHPDVTGRTILAAPLAGGEWLARANGDRGLPDPARNFSGTVTRGPEVNQVVNSFRNVWSVESRTAQLPVSMAGSLGGSAGFLGGTLGYLGSLTYSRSEDLKLEQRRARVGTGNLEIDRYDGEEGASSVLWGGLANFSLLLGSHSQIHLSNNLNRSAENQARMEVGTDENTRSLVQVDRLTYVERAVRSHQLQGQHLLSARHRVDWSLTNSAVSRSEPDRSEFVTWLDPAVPIWFKDFEGAVRTFGSLEEESNEGALNYAFSFWSSRGEPSRLRVGVTHRRSDRETESVGFRIQPFDWNPQDPRWQLPPEDFFDGRFAGDEDDLFILAYELAGGSYDAADQLSAGYVMTELNLSDELSIVGGARVEHYTLDVNSQNQLGQSNSVTKEYTDVLPALSARYRLFDGHQVRASAARTLARPEYREVAPITYREVLGGEQVIGNVNLERTLIDNLDLRWEWYPRPGEVMAIGVFGKWFDQPIEQRFLARSGTDTRTFENGESATNFGIELEADRRLDILHSSLERFSVFTNLTLMRSRLRTGQEADAERAMVGQAPYVVNAGLTYSDPFSQLSLTILYNHVGQRIMNARASGSQVDDVIEVPRDILDLSLRFPFLAGAMGKLDLKNLLDAPYEVVQGTITREFHRTGRSASLGLSWRW